MPEEHWCRIKCMGHIFKLSLTYTTHFQQQGSALSFTWLPPHKPLASRMQVYQFIYIFIYINELMCANEFYTVCIQKWIGRRWHSVLASKICPKQHTSPRRISWQKLLYPSYGICGSRQICWCWQWSQLVLPKMSEEGFQWKGFSVCLESKKLGFEIFRCPKK